MPWLSWLSPRPSLPRQLLTLDRLPLLAEEGELLPLPLSPRGQLPLAPLCSRLSSGVCAAADWSVSRARPADQSIAQSRFDPQN